MPQSHPPSTMPHRRDDPIAYVAATTVAAPADPYGSNYFDDAVSEVTTSPPAGSSSASSADASIYGDADHSEENCFFRSLLSRVQVEKAELERRNRHLSTELTTLRETLDGHRKKTEGVREEQGRLVKDLAAALRECEQMEDMVRENHRLIEENAAHRQERNEFAIQIENLTEEQCRLSLENSRLREKCNQIDAADDTEGRKVENTKREVTSLGIVRDKSYPVWKRTGDVVVQGPGYFSAPVVDLLGCEAPANVSGMRSKWRIHVEIQNGMRLGVVGAVPWRGWTVVRNWEISHTRGGTATRERSLMWNSSSI